MSNEEFQKLLIEKFDNLEEKVNDVKTSLEIKIDETKKEILEQIAKTEFLNTDAKNTPSRLR